MHRRRSCPDRLQKAQIDDGFGALATGDESTEVTVMHAEVSQYIRKLLTNANETKILKGASFVVRPNVNAL